MTPFFSDSIIAAGTYEDRIERTISHAYDLYDLDGETFCRCRDGQIETGSWEAVP